MNNGNIFGGTTVSLPSTPATVTYSVAGTAGGPTTLVGGSISNGGYITFPGAPASRGSGSLWTSPTTDPGFHVPGKEPHISLDNGDKINLNELSSIMDMFKILGNNQMALPFPDPVKLKKYEVLQIQWLELMDLARQYKITEALFDDREDNK